MAVKELKPDEIADFIVTSLYKKYGKELSQDAARCGVGCALSSLHSAMLKQAKVDGDLDDTIHSVLHTMEVLFSCLEKDCKELGIENVEFHSSRTEPNAEAH